jgi:hypothetical protein
MQWTTTAKQSRQINQKEKQIKGIEKPQTFLILLIDFLGRTGEALVP